MRKEVVKILHFVPNLGNGGTENFIMNVYRNIDRDKVQFDFVVHTNKIGVFEDEINKLGGNIYRLPVKDNYNFIKYIRELKKIFREKKYKIIHVAMPSIAFLILKIAKKENINIRIAHSHSAFHDNNLRGWIKHFTSKLIKKYSTINLACSNKAGKYLFEKNEFMVIHNAIKLDNFLFDEIEREKIREKYGIKDDEILLGHIGRISKEKNHKFLINLVQKLSDEKYKLLLVGTGPDEKKIKKIVNKYNLNNRIIFVGNRNDANKFYNAFDIFLLPSLYEGLPTVAIEAQVNGLPCILSDQITDEVKINENCVFLNLDVDLWENKILANYISNNRKINLNLFRDYNIVYETKKIENIYLKLLREDYEKDYTED